MIFKKNIADKLEDNIMELIEKHKKTMDFKSQIEISDNKINQAENRTIKGLAATMLGGITGVGGMIASLKLGIGAAVIATSGMTVGGAIFAVGVVGIAVPALAYIGINEMVKMHHERVKEKNENKGGYIKAENAAIMNFSKKIEKMLGRDSDTYKQAYASGLLNDIASGFKIDQNTEKLLEMTRKSKISSKEVNKQRPIVS